MALAIDLFCGLGGWTEGLLAEGYRVIGFDTERHYYGSGGYPAQLVLEDVQQLHGKQFRDAALMVASPPCQAYSYMAMPWSRAKAMATEIRADVRRQLWLNALFNTCFRIQHEASVAAGRHVPMVVENVKGAQPWVGRAAWHYGSFYLWGDVPALMPSTLRGVMNEGVAHRSNGETNFNGSAERASKNYGGSWFAIGSPGQTNVGQKVPGISWSGSDKPGYKPAGLNVTAAQRYRQERDDFGWDKSTPLRNNNSKSDSRKAASAQIAKIPLPLSRWIARCYLPAA